MYAYVNNCFGQGNNLAFYNNTCIAMAGNGYASTCRLNPTMTVNHNSVYSQTGDMPNCGGLKQWLAGGHDPGSSINVWPSDASAIGGSAEVEEE